MAERTPQFPPVISPIITNSSSPLWSVMIPAYNCFRYLRNTLGSVLVQDQGTTIMQIEVIDDCSTDGDVEALVKEIGQGRIAYFRQRENVGSLRNFETCVNRAKGQLVHLLHGDDLVEKGYYKEIESLFNKFPQIGAAFTKFSYVDERGNEIRVQLDQVLQEAGIIDNWLYMIAQRQLVQPPAIVVKRSVYEHLGGFYGVHYGEDWEMWIRIAAHYPVAYSPKCLAVYRRNQTDGVNITSRAFMTGQNIKDILKVIGIAQNYLPEEKKEELRKVAKKNFAIHYAKASNRIYSYSKKAAFVQAWGALRMHLNVRTIFYVFKLYLMHLLPFITFKVKEE